MSGMRHNTNLSGLIGLVTRVAGNLIHLLLLVALAVLACNLVTGRRSV